MTSTDHLRYQMAGDGHLKVWRDDDGDGITWDELHAVKVEVFGPDTWCVEHYPSADELVNEVNMRHLWLVGPELVAALPRMRGR